MKQLTKNIVAAVAISLAGAAVAAVIWVVATTPGTRWFLASVTRLGEVTVQKIEGRIIDHLLLTEVRVKSAHQELEIDRIELRWKPLLLLAGTVAVQELVINGVRIQDDTQPDDKPPVLAWPAFPESGQLFDGRITRLRVTGLAYRRLQGQTLQVTDIAGSLTWQDGLLTMTELKALSPYGQLNGSFSSGFRKPSFTADLAVVLSQPLAGMEQFSLLAGQKQGESSELLAGTFTLAGTAGSRKLLELSGEAGMARDAINLRALRLTRLGQKGLITADGSLAFSSPEPVLSLQVQATGLDLAPESNVPADLSGALRFSGTPDSYQGDFTLVNQAQGWQAAIVSAQYQGVRDAVKLTAVTGSILDGSLAGNLDINWRNGFAMQGAISGRNLNPARLDPSWRGELNFNATGRLASTGKAPLTGSVGGSLLGSRLHGQALTGLIQADFSGNNLSLARLVLKGAGFDLHASGELKRRVAMSARISDLSRLVPGSSGTLQADGWLRWRDRQLSGAVAGTGKKLSYAGMQIADARLTARLDEGAGYPLHVDATLREALYKGYTLNVVTVAADGTLLRHTVNATLRSSAGEAQLALSAGYNAGFWKGEVTGLAGKDSSGPWRLKAPAAFAVSAGKVSLSTLALTAGAGEHLDVAIDLTLNPLSGQGSAQWTGIDLARFTPLFPRDSRIKGRISGRAKGIMLPGQRFQLDGNAVFSAGELHRQSPNGELNLVFRSATASWGWREEALTGTASLTMADYGQARADFQLPVPARFPVAPDPKGPLKGSFTGKLREKGIITTLFPGLVQESSGELDAGLAVSGTWGTPQFSGTVLLTKGGAYLPAAGIHLKEVRLAARLENNLIRIDSFRALSGPGHIEGRALLTMAGWRVIGYQGTIRGENFQILSFPELQIQTTPNLTFEGTPQKLTLRGELSLPELHIVGAPSHKVIAPSSDVILEGRAAPVAKRSPLTLDVQIKLLLGENVLVNYAGIDARLGGAMDLSFSSFDRINSRGEIRVVKGRYRTYGVNLDIVRGRLFYAGGSIDRPTLDFLALRTIGNVRAGVTVTGNLRKPVTRLYSEPAMPDVDILAYIVLGHPIGSSGEQAGLLAQAAGALLTSGQAEVLQEQIKSKFGLSTLEIQGGVGGTPNHMGYKPLQVTPPGAIPAVQQSGITETMLTVGKYLTPQLYVSYGKSLFTGSNLFLLRYDIFKHWQVETQTGSESGVDLFYKLEFM